MSETLTVANSWPASLPLPVVEYGGDPQIATLFSDWKENANVLRRRRTRRIYPAVSVTWRFSPSEYEAFQSFFNDDLGLGTAAFSIEVRYPQNSALTVWMARIIGGYESSPIDLNSVWEVSAALVLFHETVLDDAASQIVTDTCSIVVSGGGGDSFECYAEEGPPITSTLNGGNEWSDAWMIAINYIGVQGLEDYEAYSEESPITSTLNSGYGYSGAWVIELNYAKIQGLDDFEAYSTSDLVLNEGWGWTDEWVTDLDIGDPNQLSDGLDDFEDYTVGDIGYSIATPQYNFTNFVDWDVVSGAVDLIGYGFWDFFPTEGLYIDMAGTPGLGFLRTKTAFDFTAGISYRFELKVAGNQRASFDTTMRMEVGEFLYSFAEEYYRPMAWLPAFDWTATLTQSDKIELQLLSTGNNYIGTIVGGVKLTRLSDMVVLFEENFDDENVIYTALPYGGEGWTGNWVIEGNYTGLRSLDTCDTYTAGGSVVGLNAGDDWDGVWEFSDY